MVTRVIFSRVPPNRMIRSAGNDNDRTAFPLPLLEDGGKREEEKNLVRSRVCTFSRENGIIDREPRSIRKDEKCGFCRRKRSIKLCFNDARILRMPKNVSLVVPVVVECRKLSIKRASDGNTRNDRLRID